MQGQWVGRVTEGTNKGFCILNFESRTPSWGRIMFCDADLNFLSMWAIVSFTVLNETLIGKLSNFLIFNENNLLIESEKLNLLSQDDKYPTSGDVKGILKNGELEVEFKTDIGSYGKAIFQHPGNDESEQSRL